MNMITIGPDLETNFLVFISFTSDQRHKTLYWIYNIFAVVLTNRLLNC